MRSALLRTIPSLLLVGVLALGACGDDTAAPEPGFVEVTLTSPEGPEGGAVFLVRGEEVTRVETGSGVTFVRPSAGDSRIVVVRDAAGPIGFRMEVEDIHRPPTVELLEVAGPDDRIREPLSGYRVEVGR